MLGSHVSIAGGIVNALHQAKRLKLDCVQVFTKNQRQWKCAELDDTARDAWLQAAGEMGWRGLDPSGTARIVAHNSYLINLAQPDPELWRKCVAAQRIEIERCEALDIPLCVTHPGAHLSEGGGARAMGRALGAPPTRQERAGLRRIAKALNAIHMDLPGYRTITCLETTAGSGTHLGYDFRHLAYIRRQVREPERIGFCLDTCHVFAAGYDIRTEAQALAMLEQWDEVCGLPNLRAFHFNDSVGALGSRLDRHAHIGQGACGTTCFRVILNHPAFSDVPKILETPKGVNERGVACDLINIRRLRRMTRQPVLGR